VVVVIAIGYPALVLAGGRPSFPSRDDCVHPARTDGNLEVVFGRSESFAQASELLRRVLRAGFEGSQIEPDGCGLLKVAVHGIPTLKVGNQVMAEARSVGLSPQLEAATE
jgi:hypothetical protein